MGQTAETTAYKKKVFLELLEKHKGVVSYACNATKTSRVTHYRWMKDDAVYAEAVVELTEESIDFVESKLFELINGVHYEVKNRDGSVTVYKDRPCKTSIIFYLKTIGKKRGYVERQEVTGLDGAPLIVNVIPDE